MSEKAAISGKCPLCLEQKVLVDSHIIPKFLWKQLKKDDRYFYIITSDVEKKERKEQKDITEYLLCSNCDNVVLQKNEDHLARVLFGGKNIEAKDQGGMIIVSGFDYRRVKNGLLSILWRMSLSSHDYFKEVKLGEKHTERIRSILLNAETVAELEYPINFCAPFLEGKFYRDAIVPPDFIRIEGNRIYRCLISGFLFTFIIGSAKIDNEFLKLNIKKEGSWAIIKGDVSKLPFLKHLYLQIERAQNAREQNK